MFEGKSIKHVINREGFEEEFRPEIIVSHLENLAKGNVLDKKIKSLNINTIVIITKVMKSIKNKISTSKLDEQACEEALGLYSTNPDFEKLALRIAVSNHLKNIKAFSFKILGEDSKKGTIYSIARILKENNILADYIGEGMMKYYKELEEIVDPINNFKLSFRGFFLLFNKNYLLHITYKGEKVVVETPDFLSLRVAFSIVCSQEQWTSSEIFLRKKLRSFVGNISDEEFEKLYWEEQFLFKRQEDKEEQKLTMRELKKEDFEQIRKIYNFISKRLYTHATPSLFNSGFIRPQLSSCYTFGNNKGDNLTSIADNWDAMAQAQKNSGGIGNFLGFIRASGSPIKGTNGISNGLVPLCRTDDKLGHYIDQGGGKRSGSNAPYIPDWHSDLIDALYLRKVHNSSVAEEQHKLYYAVILSDLFFRKFLKDEDWYFFSPYDAYILNNVYDEKFSLEEVQGSYEELCEKGFRFTAEYNKLVLEKKYFKIEKARNVVNFMLSINAESGVPYYVSKDNINRNRAQDSIIYTSNLCAEILLPTNEKEIGVCNLASLSMKKYFRKISKYDFYEEFLQKNSENPYCSCENFLGKKTETHFHETPFGLIAFVTRFNDKIEHYVFDEKLLKEVVCTIIQSLDRIIDINYYPRPEMRYSNKKRRPMAIGVMAFADTLSKLLIPFGSFPAKQIAAFFHESVYYFAVEESIRLAQIHGSIENFKDYPAAKGLLQPHLYQKNFKIIIKQRKDWDDLGEKAKSGMRNSVLIALMPTGNTSIIMGNSSSVEPHVSNIYRWKSSSRDLLIVNKYILKDAQDLNLNSKFLERFNQLSGDVQNLNLKYFTFNKEMDSLKEERFKKIYRTIWNIDPEDIIIQSAVRIPYVDQSISMSLWLPEVNTNSFNYLILGLSLGLKTLSYYIHSKSSTEEQKTCTGCAI